MVTSSGSSAGPARRDRRTLLIEAASKLFTEHPYDEVTTTEIARRAGVAYGLIAHHFASKRGLYPATIEAAAERLREVHETPPAGHSPAARLHDGLATATATLAAALGAARAIDPGLGISRDLIDQLQS